MIRVLIADDQPGVRHGIKVILREFTDIEVVGEGSSGPEAVALADELLPDVVLMDVRMPEGDGISAARKLIGADRKQPIAVIMMTTFDLDEYLFGALEAGVSGFLVKNSDSQELSAAIHAAARGDAMISPAVTRRVLAAFGTRRRGAGAGRPDHAAPPSIPLSPRDLTVLKALSAGLSNAEIAERLHLEPSTVRAYVSQLISKTRTNNRTHLVVWAFRHGLVD